MNAPRLFLYILCLSFLLINTSIKSYGQRKSSNRQLKQPSGWIQALPMDPKVKVGKLANGFTYYLRKNTEPKNRAQLYLVNKIGSIVEEEDQLGVAHFIEHMGFNGTKNYPKNELLNYLQKVGVSPDADLNAYTSFNKTVYQLFIPTDDTTAFNNGIQIMRDWAQDALLDSTEIEKERGVILEEKRLAKGASARMQRQFVPMLMNWSRYVHRPIIGTEERIQKVDVATLRKFYKDWYRPNLQGLIVVGDIDLKAVEKLIRHRFSDLKNPKDAPERMNYSIPLIHKNQFIAVTDSEQVQIEVALFIKRPKRVIRTPADLYHALIPEIYNYMLDARLKDLLHQADPPFLNAASNRDISLSGLECERLTLLTKTEGLEKGFKAVLAEIERAKRFGFTQTELDRAKAAFMTYLQTQYKERNKTDSREFAHDYLQDFLEQSPSTSIDYLYNFYKKNNKKITLSKIHAMGKKYLSEVNRDIIILAPTVTKHQLPDETMINTWMAQVSLSKTLKPFVDQVVNKPLLASKPVPGKIISEKIEQSLGITHLTLSNGARVLLKPTPFKNDEILFTVCSPGGSSLYADADFLSANYAAHLILGSGLGEFDCISLEKLLSGKPLSFSAFIKPTNEGLYGHTTPEHLETVLQLIYSCFVQPRKDEKIFENYIQGYQEQLMAREKDPTSFFTDSLRAILFQYDPRYSCMSKERVSEINLHRAYEIFKERFTDASDFTFIFVGSFDPQKIKPLLEQYAGGLPAAGRKEVGLELAKPTPTGQISKTFYKGQEDKAEVFLNFSGPYSFTLEHHIRVDALAQVLSQKLRERLREEESSVYAVSAKARYSKAPIPYYNLQIEFGCAPQNVEKLISATFEEIEQLKQDGFTEADIQQVVSQEQRTIETALQTNEFWVDHLYNTVVEDEALEAVHQYPELLKKISVENLKETAHTCLRGDNLIRCVLLPEKESKTP